MLVIHPGSQCDVCLEPYTADSSVQSPHAIPCGHIFCRRCLGTFDPPNCPLCRKPFAADRIKKLHVDKPEADEVRQADYLNRLILAWGDDEDELVSLLDPIQSWLESKEDEECRTIRKALNIMSRYQRLKTKRVDDHRVIKRLTSRLVDEDRERASQNEGFKVVEGSLRTEIGDLKETIKKQAIELVRLREIVDVNPGLAELQLLRRKVSEYETTLDNLNPLVKKQDKDIKKLRQELEYFTNLNPASSYQPNPLPQPPAPVSYEHLISNGRYASGSKTHEIPYVNGHANDSFPHADQMPKKNKGKEREPGPSYNLSTTSMSSSESTVTASIINTSSASSHRRSSNSPPEQVLRGASPGRRVVPTSTTKPSLPEVPIKHDPKLVSGARPDQPVPPTPPQHHSYVSLPNGFSTSAEAADPHSQQPQRAMTRNGGVDPARDFLDPYTLTAAYITEYAAGYGAGYQLAEYTPGEAARVIPHQSTGTAISNAVAYVNGGERRDREREREREGQRGLDNMNSLGMVLPDPSSTPTARSSQISRDGNSQVYNIYDDASVTTGASAISSINRATDESRAPRVQPSHASLASDAQSQKTQTTGYRTDTATLSSVSTGLTGMTEDSLLSRNQSLRRSNSRRSMEVTQNQSHLGSGLPSALHGTASSEETSRPRPSRHTSLPVQPIQPVPVHATTVSHATTIAAAALTAAGVAGATTTTTAAAVAATQVVADNNSVRTASSWGTINTHSMPLLDWQSTGSSLSLPLRGFGSGTAGMSMNSTAVEGLENWGPIVPEGMVVTQATGNGDSGRGRNGVHESNRDANANGGGEFPVVRESDEERTPMSRSTRTLASVSSAGSTNGSGARPLMEYYGIAISQGSAGNRAYDRESGRDRERNRERDQRDISRRASRSRDRRRQSQPAPVTHTLTGQGAGGGSSRYAQMTTASEHRTGAQEPRSSNHHSGSSHSGADVREQVRQSWMAFTNNTSSVAQAPPPSSTLTSSSYVQPRSTQLSSAQPQNSSQAYTGTSQPPARQQSRSNRSNRRLSVSIAPLAGDTQHSGPLSAAVVPNTAPAWSEAGYYTDGPSISHSQHPHSHHHHSHNHHLSTIYSNANTPGAGGGGDNATPNPAEERGQSLLTSPTLFSSSASSNALGLDGLNEPRPLQITAPTPIVSSRSFLRSFSYDNYS